MAINLTSSQRQAVEKKGNILVAAAAGSGKTAVLVERVINMLCSKEEPVRADNLLIVTFTNAAAAEMRSRIQRRLDEECLKNPNDTSLQMQKHLLSVAKICTIDSFCIDLVRENFERLGISPDFTVSDGNALKPINNRVLNRLLAPYFENRDPLFSELLDIVGAEFDEEKLVELVLDIYDYSRQLPFPEKWINSLPEFYNRENNIWKNYAINKVLKQVIALRSSLANAVDLVTVDKRSADTYLPCMVDAAEKLEALHKVCEDGDWNKIYDTLQRCEILKLPQIRTNSGIPEIIAVKEIYAGIRNAISEDLPRLIYEREEFIHSQFKKLYEPLKLLAKIVCDFENEVFDALNEENTFTFHHTESMALRLLCEEKDGEVVITHEAEDFLNRFSEVCVDEYQDTNDLQNMLFYVLSNRDSRLFAVGDVKQSIYSFRGANPKNFLQKKNSRLNVENSADGDPIKIILGNNFRSNPKVCDFANYFFKLFMNSETGDIVYNEEEMLIASGEFPENDGTAVGMDIILSGSSEEKAKILEARQIAKFIKETMQNGEILRATATTLRGAEYSDFTILLRSMKNNASIFAEELRLQGIPVNFAGEGFCEFYEVATILSLLKVIDNPDSDVELLAVLMSPVFGYSAEDLAILRTKHRDVSLYNAINLASREGDLRAAFVLKKIQKYRLFSVTNTLPKLINILLDDTDLLNIFSALPQGNRRRNNLMLLCEYAKSYSASPSATVGGFVKYLVKQDEKGIKSAAASFDGGAVNIMSIHSSKGLQFPICIVAGTSSLFNNSEAKEKAVYNTKLGLGLKYFDENDKKPYTTIGREVILDYLKQERLEEEMRLLYVAMTRTQDILHFTGVLGDSNKKLNALISRLLGSDCKIDGNYWCKTRSYMDWLLTALLLHPDGKELRGNALPLILSETDSHIHLRIIEGDELSAVQSREITAEPKLIPELFAAVKENFEYSYPYGELCGIQSKASVSILANKAESEKYSFSAKPSFMSQGGITATGRGTAMHKVMEFFDFSKWEAPEREIERLYEWQFLSETEAESVSISALKKFFAGDVFARILKSKVVKREMRFLTQLSAAVIKPDLSDRLKGEDIIVQGAVDVCFAEDDGIVILDFKTDRTDNPQELITAYGEQLNIYGLACEKIFKMPVKEKIIYSFHLNKEIIVDI